ncbi:MAG TPA: hypothetical protein VGK95_13090 [Caldimonas sp.]
MNAPAAASPAAISSSDEGSGTRRDLRREHAEDAVRLGVGARREVEQRAVEEAPFRRWATAREASAAIIVRRPFDTAMPEARALGAEIHSTSIP